MLSLGPLSHLNGRPIVAVIKETRTGRGEAGEERIIAFSLVLEEKQ